MEESENPTESPAGGPSARLEQLRSLVRFAMVRGYYEPWNRPPDRLSTESRQAEIMIIEAPQKAV